MLKRTNFYYAVKYLDKLGIKITIEFGCYHLKADGFLKSIENTKEVIKYASSKGFVPFRF